MLKLRVLTLTLMVFAITYTRPVLAQVDTGRIDEVLERMHEYHLLNGSVLVAKGDEPVYVRGFGQANMEWDIENTPEARFRIGSVTKQFTAALILQLVEDGRVDLQGTITDYLPEYPKAQGDRVTIHHLLNHTSGIPSYTGFPEFWQELNRDHYEPDSFLTVFSGLPLEFDPGTEFRYNNSGYFILGAIIERITGKTYEQVLRDRIFQPLNLDGTGYDNFGEVIERRAAGYRRVGSGYENAPYLDTSLPYAAGMMYSTVTDLHRWTRALHAGRPFRKPETLRLMTTPHMQGYGYGINVGDVGVGDTTVRMIRHGGGIPGFTSELWYLPEQEFTIVVLDNTNQNAGVVADALARALLGQPIPEPKRPIADVIARIIETDGVERAAAQYHTLRQEQPDAYDFREGQLNQLGYEYLQNGDVETAIRVFQLNVEAFPEAFNTYDSLAEAYLKAGNREEAIAHYQKALALNPGSESARSALRKLGVEAPDTTASVPLEILQTYVGRYELKPTFSITITREGERLYGQATGQSRFELFPSSENSFYLKEVDARVTFNRNAVGTVESLTLHQNGQNIPGRKVE